MEFPVKKEWDTAMLAQDVCHLIHLALHLQTDGGQYETTVS
jgi:hypothetical protein